MIKKIINFISNLFKKEEEKEMPEEYIVIDYSESAKLNGLKGDEFKEITVFSPKDYLRGKYPYDVLFLKNLVENESIPFVDLSGVEDEKLQPITSVDPWLLKYKKVVR